MKCPYCSEEMEKGLIESSFRRPCFSGSVAMQKLQEDRDRSLTWKEC